MEQQANETRELMMSIARNAIESRAARDGHAQGTYDAEHDPEGYVTSLLNALHRWCHENGLDWDAEVDRAQDLFNEDTADSRIGVPSRAPATVDELRCPACGHEGSFCIEMCENVVVFADGDAVYGDEPSQWHDGSYCACEGCRHLGRVRNFRKPVAGEKGNQDG